MEVNWARIVLRVSLILLREFAQSACTSAPLTLALILLNVSVQSVCASTLLDEDPAEPLRRRRLLVVQKEQFQGSVLSPKYLISSTVILTQLPWKVLRQLVQLTLLAKGISGALHEKQTLDILTLHYSVIQIAEVRVYRCMLRGPATQAPT